MAPTREDLELAMAAYWGKKDEQLAAAQLSGSTAEGSSKAVRGGGHFNPIANLIARFFLDAGYSSESIHASGPMTRLPGYYRPTKAWDLVVVHDGVLVAAVELKALGGPSFGNNYNNRVEEALGNGVDLERANWRELVGREKPWLGYFFIIQDEEGSRKPGRPGTGGAFQPDRAWEGASYQERFALTGERMLDQGIYDAVYYAASSREDPGPREPSLSLDWQHFSAAIQARIKYLEALGLPS